MLRVNCFSRVTPRTWLGENVHFNGMQIQGVGRVQIGDNFHSGTDCLIICSSHNYDKSTLIPYDDVDVDKDVVIQDNVWLGSRVTIIGRVTIGEGAIIQAGSVVVKDVPYCGIAGGNPAKVFKTRDTAHYEKLKAAGKVR